MDPWSVIDIFKNWRSEDKGDELASFYTGQNMNSEMVVQCASQTHKP